MQKIVLHRNRGFQTALLAGGVLVVSMVLSIFAMKMLGGHHQRQAPAPAKTAAAKPAARPKRTATFKPKPVQTRKVARAVHTQLPYAAGAQFMQAAQQIAKRKWGTGVLDGSKVSVSMLCTSGYSVVIWRNPSPNALASVSLYLRRAGSGWDAVSGIYSRFTVTGAPGDTHRFGLGSAPVGVDCFDPM